MRNPLVPTLANFFMGTLENTLFNNENEGNQFTVDDIFCTFRKDVMVNNF